MRKSFTYKNSGEVMETDAYQSFIGFYTVMLNETVAVLKLCEKDGYDQTAAAQRVSDISDRAGLYIKHAPEDVREEMEQEKTRILKNLLECIERLHDITHA